MTSFIRSAKCVHDVESDLSYIEINYDRYTKKRGYSVYTDFVNTEALADWTILECKEKSIPYVKFLETMVKETMEVQQRIAELRCEELFMTEQTPEKYVRVVHAIKILDPTFQPPRVNMGSAWQMEMLKRICKIYTSQAIQECVQSTRLKYFNDVLRIIILN